MKTSELSCRVVVTDVSLGFMLQTDSSWLCLLSSGLWFHFRSLTSTFNPVHFPYRSAPPPLTADMWLLWHNINLTFGKVLTNKSWLQTINDLPPHHKPRPYCLPPYLLSQLSELFVSFEEKPQGAASLAQVHKAVLHDGRTVALKIQHPKVQTQSSKDIMVMEVSGCRFLKEHRSWQKKIHNYLKSKKHLQTHVFRWNMWKWMTFLLAFLLHSVS